MPLGLSEITRLERSLWTSRGPLVGEDGLDIAPNAAYCVWPDVGTWATFYGAVRGELLAHRPRVWQTSIAEAMYQAWRAGLDPEAARDAAMAARAANDPRLLLMADDE